MGIQKYICVRPETTTQIGLSKDKILILKIGLSKENGGIPMEWFH
jgi:hypothetical protein